MRILLLDEENIINKKYIKTIEDICIEDVLLSCYTLAQMDRIIIRYDNKFKILKERYNDEIRNVIYNEEDIINLI